MWNEENPRNDDAEAEANKADNPVMGNSSEAPGFPGDEGRSTRPRERSLSVPSRSEASNVETVVTKAKKASSYLWMLLHSQSCRLGVDRCTHSGCSDAKLVHLHLKTCPAGQGFPCPTRYNGCLQARKLLAHYRQCRNIRARQVGQSPSVKGQHVCLICSMVARHARSLLDSRASSVKPTASQQQGTVIAHKKGGTNSKCQVISSFALKAKLNVGTLGGVSCSSFKPDPVQAQRKIVASFTLSSDSSSAEFFPNAAAQPSTTTPKDWSMPPPARRAPRATQSAPVSPTDVLHQRQELSGKSASLLAPMPLISRRRSGSLGSDIRPRAVSFATSTRPECLIDQRLAVELAAATAEAVAPGEVLRGDASTTNQRTRSASCHLLSSGSGSSQDLCGTIHEEVGPAASYMEE